MSDTLLILGRDWLEITAPVSVLGEVAFDLTVTAKNGHGDTDTGYTACQIVLEVTDPEGTNLLCTIDGQATDEATMTAGVATFNDVVVTVPGGTDFINVRATTKLTTAAIKGSGYEDHGYQPEGNATAAADNCSLVITTQPTSVVRGTPFTLTVEMQRTDGSVVDTATDTFDITLVGADPNDKFTSPDPDVTTYTATLTAGVYSIAQTISGGAGTDAGNTITISIDDTEIDATSAFAIRDASVTFTISTDTNHPSGFYGVDGDASRTTSQSTAISTFSADTSLGTGGGSAGTPWNDHNIGVWYNAYGSWTYSLGHETYVFAAPIYFTISNEVKQSGLVSARLNVAVAGIGYVVSGGAYSLVGGVNSLKVIYTEGQQYTSGSQLISAAADKTFTDTEINSLQVAAGWTAGSPVIRTITLDLGDGIASFIREMSGNTLGIWLCPTFNSYEISGPATSYKMMQAMNYTTTLEVLA